MATTKGSASKKKDESRNPIRVGKNAFIQCVTHYYTGHIIEVTETEIVIDQAAWIPDTGRFNEALARGQFGEVEPYPDDVPVAISRGGIVAVSEWKFPLPRAVK